jgi:hypothetical protein
MKAVPPDSLPNGWQTCWGFLKDSTKCFWKLPRECGLLNISYWRASQSALCHLGP